jgi:cysteinyl-tRNA synthetase, unknown class
MGTYEKGDSDEEVGRVQAKLGIVGDGEFGAETVAAVKAWQKANGVKVDGMVNPDMLLALGLDDLVVVEKGDEGELVRGLQAALGVKADGEFGSETDLALKAYQKQNGQKANGRALVATLAALGVTGGEQAEEPTPQPAPAAPAPIARSRPAPVSAKPKSTPVSGAVRAGPINAWAYQLADIAPDAIANLPVDLCVIDYSADGEDSTAFKVADTDRMKTKPDGGRKLLISYMSIGEAEDYRYYWQTSWGTAKTRPAWLDDLNPDWEGNYKVRFWDPAWQGVIFGSPNSYLDKIIAAGFDGVYLDIIDAFEYWRDEKPERPSAADDMIAFVTAIANYARARRPGFWIIPQNGEALLEDAAYRKVISAQAKEDIFFGQDGDGRANKRGDIDDCLDNLKFARDSGLPILAIEYLEDGKKVSEAQTKLASVGCTATFGPRDLATIDLSQFKA